MSPGDLNKVILELEKGLKEYPDKRRAIIVLGQLYSKKLNKPTKTIDILERGLLAVKTRRPNDHKDIADIHYNIACYYCMLAHELGITAEEKAVLKDKLYENLAPAVHLSSENVAEARTDADFSPIKSEQAFINLVPSQ